MSTLRLAKELFLDYLALAILYIAKHPFNTIVWIMILAGTLATTIETMRGDQVPAWFALLWQLGFIFQASVGAFRERQLREEKRYSTILEHIVGLQTRQLREAEKHLEECHLDEEPRQCSECGGDGVDLEDTTKDCWKCDGKGYVKP